MEILRTLRKTYCGEEYLIRDDEDHLKRLKVIDKTFCVSEDELIMNINTFKIFDSVLLPESFSYKEKLELIYPYDEEEALNLKILNSSSRDYLSYKLLEFSKKVYQSYNYTIPFFSLEDVLITKDKDFKIILPIFLNPEKLDINNNALFFAPEFKISKTAKPESILHVIGQVIYEIDPSKEIKDNVKNFIDDDVNQRFFDFDLVYSIESFVKEKIFIPLIYRKEYELIQKYINNKEKKMIGVIGTQRIGKSTFLGYIQSLLNKNDFVVVRSTTPESVILNLLRIYKKNEDYDKELYYSLFECIQSKECRIETIISLAAKIINSIKNVVIIVDNYNEIPENFKTFLTSLKALKFRNKFLIFAASTYNFSIFDEVIELNPFDEHKTNIMLEKMLGNIENKKDLVDFIFKFSEGVPGIIVEIIRLFVEKGFLVKNKYSNEWIFKKENIVNLELEEFFDVYSEFEEKELEKMRVLSILGEKFTTLDIKMIEDSLNENFEKILKILRIKGIVYKEYHTYRFTLKRYWEKLYYSLDKARRKELHLKLINTTYIGVSEEDVLLKKAWHFKMIGEYSKAICTYLKLIRKGLNEYFSPSYLLNLISEVEVLLPDKRISYTLVRFKAELYYRLNKKVDFELPNKKIFEYWKIALKYIDMKNDEVINYFESDKSRLEGYGKIGTYRRILLYYYALYNKGKIKEIKIKILKEIFNKIKSVSYFANDVKVRAAILLSMVVRNRDLNLAKEYLNLAKKLAKKYNLLHLLPFIYTEIADLINNIVVANGYYEKSIKASYECTLPDLSVNAQLNKIRFLLYMGDTKGFFNQLYKIREELELKNLNVPLANTYILETLFYIYDRNFEKGFETIQKAKEIQEELEIGHTYLRTLILLYLFCNKKEKARELFEKNKDKNFIKTLDFDLFTELVLAEKDDIEEKWKKFKNSTTFLWREEAYALIGEKIARIDPDSFFEHLKSLESDYATQNLRLSLALLYESFSKYYKIVNKEYRFRNYLSKAFSLYSDLDFKNYVEMLKKNYYFLSEKFKKYAIFKDVLKNKFVSPEFVKIVERYNYAMNILEELKAIEVFEEPSNILHYFAGKIYDIISVNEIAFYLNDERIQRKFEFSTLEDDSILNVSGDILNNNPLLIKVSDKIDKFLNYTIVIYDKSSVLSETKMNELLERFEIIEYAFITVVKSIFARLRSVIDPLTKLYTRYFFNERLENLFLKSKALNTDFSIIMADIDHFKLINDKFGHLFGDEVLKEISSVLLKILRNSDVVGRFGGEEFIILLTDTNIKTAYEVAERLRKEIEKIDKFPQKITMSFGVVSYPEIKAKTPEELIGFADDALYKAKEFGRNRVVVFGRDF